MSLRAIRGTRPLPVIDIACADDADPAPQQVTINVLVMPAVHVVPAQPAAPALPPAPASPSFRRQLAAYDAPAEAIRTFKTVV